MSKKRLSASVDVELVEAADRAVALGRAKNLSAWVNDALLLKLEHDRRQDALAAFIAEYEDAHGEITEEEMRLAGRRVRARAVGARALTERKAKPSRSKKRASR